MKATHFTSNCAGMHAGKKYKFKQKTSNFSENLNIQYNYFKRYSHSKIRYFRAIKEIWCLVNYEIMQSKLSNNYSKL